MTDENLNIRLRPKQKFNFFQDQRVRSIFYQLITAGIVGWFIWYLFTNTSQNLDARGMKSGFGFLSVQAGFDTDFKLIEYVAGVGTYGDIFLLGILNTLYISALAIIFSTIFGLIVGILRLSDNWLISKVSLAFVEIFRNTPLLIQIIFWYIGVFSILPQVRNSMDLSVGAELILLNNRGLYMPWPIPGEQFWLSGVAFMVALILIFVLRRWAHKRRDKTGQKFSLFLPSAALMLILPASVYLFTGQPLGWDIPVLEGFNFVGGAALPPAFLSLLVALTIYHSAHFAETVRAGILSVSKGQHDAASAIGLRPGRVMSLVIIPQAMPAIVPPMISQWMNAVKNSSLAIAIGYPDLVAVFMQTSLNQIGHAIEIVGMTMAFYMFVSLTISGFLNIYNKHVQRVER
ncbi:MAG: ABC transporter permease subunit [Gammaproteobacteria bacterium]|nr:ABC transporter permease subunit [Gammaproteobacteria bacterium]MBT3722144.1 ABC transporter permease subunit [Gammaproteobacteria bacterium]MBT4078732.1 ABC transporter permease subunit [Gammaproteobacteria bacterium]MBT4194605.1 ABC transporter permease subunit [Gammaproteobacteria bacterium]MBT4448879.1 ABC transporter permease subunit [Gammaproteobacteria bacterium]